MTLSRVVELTQLFAHSRQPELLQRGRERRHAGADDTDVDLNDRPEGYGRVGPGRVRGRAPMHDIVEADDAANGDEQSDEKGQADTNFLAVGDLDLHQAWEGEHEHHEVEKYVDAGTNVDLRKNIDTSAPMG